MPRNETPAEGGEPLWAFASARGMGRRQFLQLMLAGGATAVLAACVGMEPASSRPEAAATQPTAAPATDSPFFKDPAPFIRRDTAGLEARMENMQGLITPNRHFFVRNNSVSLDLDASDWRLFVEGRRGIAAHQADLRRGAQPAEPHADLLPGVRRQPPGRCSASSTGGSRPAHSG